MIDVLDPGMTPADSGSIFAVSSRVVAGLAAFPVVRSSTPDCRVMARCNEHLTAGITHPEKVKSLKRGSTLPVAPSGPLRQTHSGTSVSQACGSRTVAFRGFQQAHYLRGAFLLPSANRRTSNDFLPRTTFFDGPFTQHY